MGTPTPHAAESVAEAARDGQDASWLSDYSDSDLTFCLQGHRDVGLARACLEGLRRAFPGARLILVSDGDDDPRWPALAAKQAAEFVAGERLFAVQRGGQIVERLLELHLRAPTRWLFRLDTDTRVHRRFRWLPGGVCVFGTLEHATLGHGAPLAPPCVQGGCIGFTLAAVERLRASGVFRSPALVDWAATWADTPDTRERARNGRVSFDHLVRYGCRVAGVPAREFAEVRSLWRGRVENPGLRYAVTHPHKPWWQWPRLWLSLRVARWRARLAPGR